MNIQSWFRLPLFFFIFTFFSSILFSQENYVAPDKTNLYRRYFVKIDFVGSAPPGKSPISHVILDDNTAWFAELNQDLAAGQEVFIEPISNTSYCSLIVNQSAWKTIIDKTTKPLLPNILEITKFVSKESWCSFFDEYAYAIHLSDGSHWLVSDFTSQQAQLPIESWQEGNSILITRTSNDESWNLVNIDAPYAQIVNGAHLDKRTLSTTTCQINLLRE